MEIKEYDCFKLSKGFSTYSTEITSFDNDMAVITRSGVHVLSIIPNLTCSEEQFRIERTLIKTPTEYIQKDLTVDSESLNREKFCLLTLNAKFTPTLEKCVTATVYVKYIAFANFDSESFSKSILGVLSNQGCLQLFSKCRYNWTKLVDISLLWKKYCQSKWSSEPTENDYEAMADKLRRIRIVAFACCTGLRLGENNAWLLTCINENGTASFWNVDNNISDIAPLLINTTELNIIVHTLYWHRVDDKSGWLIACCVNGSIKLYTCEKTDSNEFKLTLTRDLWKDHDQILTTNVKVMKHSNGTTLTFSKENCVLVFLQNLEFVKYTYEFNKKVVALEILEDSTVFVMLQNNETVTLSFENKQYNCISIPFKTRTNIKNHSCWGVTFSKNKVFCAVSMSIAKSYDHLVLKEPWYVLLCCIKQQTTLPLLQNLGKALSVYDMYDYLEHFRFSSIKKKPRLEEKDLQDVWNYLNGDIELCRKMFQITYISSQFCEFSDDINYAFVFEIIFTICNYVYFAEKLKEANRRYYFYQWLSSNLPKLPKFLLKYKHLKDISEKLEQLMDSEVDEKCELCSSAISDHSHLKYVTCERKHKVLRCAFTFLPISTESYTQCSICHSLVLKSEGIRRCVICDQKF